MTASDFYIAQPIALQENATRLHRPLPDIPTVSKPLLPSLDFGSFQVISQKGEIEPASKPRPIQKQVDNSLFAYEDRNRAAGAVSAAKFASLREERERRVMTRGGSESALDKIAMPNTLGQVVRAVVATGSSGAKGTAVSPLEAPSLTRKTGSSYVALGDKEEHRLPSKTEIKTKTSANWSGLLSPLPGAPDEKKQPQVKQVEPIKTGLTSFSSSEELPPPQSSPVTPTNRRLLPRRNTNPFLNEAFMSSLSLSKTPPLSPTSPFGKSSSPGNPFARLYAKEEENEDEFHDAPYTPAEYGQVTRISVMNNNPFFESPDQQLISSSSPSKDAATGLGLIGQTTQNVSRGVHFSPDVALKASDNPRCPSCHQAFTDLEGVLHHLDQTDCHPNDISESQAIFAV